MKMLNKIISNPEQNCLKQDARQLRESLGVLPEIAVRPPFVVVSGLPGTGKSFFCRKLVDKTPFCIRESDALRKVLCSSPDYSAESTRARRGQGR